MALSDGVLGSFAPRESSHDSDGAWRLRPDVARRTVGVRVVSVVILEGSCDLFLSVFVSRCRDGDSWLW